MDIEALMTLAKSEPVHEQPHRNDKYKPIIHELANKQMKTNQIHAWLKDKGITVGTGFIARVRRVHLESIGEDADEGPEAPEVEETLQPVATEEQPPRIR
jgi:hypothetical protein